LTSLLVDYLRFSSENFSIFFRPFFWIVMLTLTAGFSLLKRNYIATLICASGLLYLLGYLLSLPAPDFRFAYWAIFAQALSSVVLLIPGAGRSTSAQFILLGQIVAGQEEPTLEARDAH